MDGHVYLQYGVGVRSTATTSGLLGKFLVVIQLLQYSTLDP